MFHRLFNDREIALFFVSKILPPIAKAELGDKEVTLHFKKRHEGIVAEYSASLHVGPLIKGKFDFANRKIVFDSQHGMHGKIGPLSVRIKEVEIGKNRRITVRPDSWIVPPYTGPFDATKRLFCSLKWA